jgi:phage terminase large subunit GpA-like protein
MMTRADEIANLNRAIAPALRGFLPPDDITVTEWAEKHRRLAGETSAESGRYRISRTPYMKEPQDAFSNPEIRDITILAGSQVGKTEVELNCLCYIIDNDPSSVLFIMPSDTDARDLSIGRIAPLIRTTPRIKGKVAEVKSRDSSNTMLRKSFPGGLLYMTGTNSASALASKPIRYLIGDEVDRWSKSAGSEGDPWELAKARTQTFYNTKRITVSTPTIKGASKIAQLYAEGTQETWQHQCPECGEFHAIVFADIKFDYDKTTTANKESDYEVKNVKYCCPECGCLLEEDVIKAQPAKWVAANPGALKKGHRSFRLNGFISPWQTWPEMIHQFLVARRDPETLQVIFNTLFGELWENRGDLDDEETFLSRREVYNPDAPGTELPEDVYLLTCGVDVQGDRLEYEVVGHGLYGETWGIRRGVLLGKPTDSPTWDKLDEITERIWQYGNGKGIKISLTCVDSGGQWTDEVYRECMIRETKRVFLVKGRGGFDRAFTPVRPTRVDVKNVAGQKAGQAWLYVIGVDSGKARIYGNLKVQDPGPKYCHFPISESAGYDMEYFKSLLSERMERKRSGGVDILVWKKIPGHERNEMLDCRNYAMAAFNILNPNMDQVKARALGVLKPARKESPAPVKKQKANSYASGGDW